jgi:hypothetical protein
MVRKRGGNFQSGSRGRAREHKRPGTYDDVFRTTRHDPRIFPPSATKRQNLESASASGWSAGATFLGLYGSRIRTYSLPSSGRPGHAVVRRSKLRTRSLAGLACHTIRTRQPPFGNRDPDPNLSRGRFVRVGVTHKPSAANSKRSARSVGSVISEGSTGPRPEQSGTVGLRDIANGAASIFQLARWTHSLSASPNMFRAFWTSACALAFSVLLVP